MQEKLHWNKSIVEIFVKNILERKQKMEIQTNFPIIDFNYEYDFHNKDGSPDNGFISDWDSYNEAQTDSGNGDDLSDTIRTEDLLNDAAAEYDMMEVLENDQYLCEYLQELEFLHQSIDHNERESLKEKTEESAEEAEEVHCEIVPCDDNAIYLTDMYSFSKYNLTKGLKCWCDQH